MTAAEDVPNVTIAGVTIYTESFEKIISKKLLPITTPQSTKNWSSGPKDTRIVDLLRMETRFTIRGTIEGSDQSTLENANKAGGVMSLVWDGDTFSVNIDKLSISKGANNESSERSVIVTCIKGVNL